MDVLIVPNADNGAALAEARTIHDALSREGHRVTLTAADAAAAGLDASAVPASGVGAPGLVVALGGDGTILKAVHVLGGADAPILGVNLGRLGFLAATDGDGLAAVRAVIGGAGREERRATLTATMRVAGRSSGTHEALNEVFIGRGPGARAVDLAITVDDEPLARWVCDGVIVATATGSTAYSLSAGGPLLAPGVRGLLVVPVNPHALRARPFVLEESSTVSVTFPDAARSDACVVVDGDMVPCRAALDAVAVSAGANDVRLVQLDGRSFVSAVRDTFL